MLGRVFDATEIADESEANREARAAKILRHFEDGISDEATLVSMVKRELGD